MIYRISQRNRNARAGRCKPETRSMKTVCRSVVIALSLMVGAAGVITTASLMTAPQAHAFGFSDITGAVKKVGGAVKGAAKTVAKDIKNTSKIVGKNAKDWGTSVGATAKDIGKGAKWVGKRVGGSVKLMADDIGIAGKAVGRGAKWTGQKIGGGAKGVGIAVKDGAKWTGKKIGRGVIVGTSWAVQCLGHCPIGQDVYVPDTWKSKGKATKRSTRALPTSRNAKLRVQKISGRTLIKSRELRKLNLKTTSAEGTPSRTKAKLPKPRRSKRGPDGRPKIRRPGRGPRSNRRSEAKLPPVRTTKSRTVTTGKVSVRSAKGLTAANLKRSTRRSKTVKRSVARDRSVMARPVGTKTKRISRSKTKRSGAKRSLSTRMQRQRSTRSSNNRKHFASQKGNRSRKSRRTRR